MTRKKDVTVPPKTIIPTQKQPSAPIENAETESHPGSQVAASFPIVGIGASAGGLAVFEQFFAAMPADVDPGMAFILVQHLSPEAFPVIDNNLFLL